MNSGKIYLSPKSQNNNSFKGYIRLTSDLVGYNLLGRCSCKLTNLGYCCVPGYFRLALS